MFKKMKHMKNEKGLTLIELLAVIVILAIIAAIAIPAIGNIINNQRDKAIMSEAVNILSGAKLAHTDGTCDATLASGTNGACEGALLNDFIDKVTLAAHDATGAVDKAYVSYDNSTKVWSITYSKFGELKKEYTAGNPAQAIGPAITGANAAAAKTLINEENLSAILD